MTDKDIQRRVSSSRAEVTGLCADYDVLRNLLYNNSNLMQSSVEDRKSSVVQSQSESSSMVLGIRNDASAVGQFTGLLFYMYPGKQDSCYVDDSRTRRNMPFRLRKSWKFRCLQ